MIERIKSVLEKAGVAPRVVDVLVQQVAEPPAGTIDATELREAVEDVPQPGREARIALLAAVVAAASPRNTPTSEVLQPLLDFVSTAQAALSAYDHGRFWHLRGVVALREDIYTAARPLNRSIALLQGEVTPPAQEYRARVLNTLGQVLEAQGLLHEAQQEFEQLLDLRQNIDDETGKAWTMGNLGRVCLELGDFAKATEYLAGDLAIIERLTPEDYRQRARLCSQLGTCALELGDWQEAQHLFATSAELADAVEDAVGLAFATLGQGQVALGTARLDDAWQYTTEALGHLEKADASSPFYMRVHGLIHQLRARVHLAYGRVNQALDAFQLADTNFRQAHGVSRVEMAHMLYAFANAHRAQGAKQEEARLLCEALRELDATSVEEMRQQVEAELRRDFPELWQLHTAGRFIGHQHIESLLDEAGREGFRGTEQEVVILFSDIRDFTSISEHLEPHELIDFLNTYLGRMTRCVERYQGTVDKFMGDAVMAIFPVEPDQQDEALRAVHAALMMQDELERFNRAMVHAEKPPLRIGVGLHSGPVVVGLIGSPQKRSYTVIGDAVNTASRLEGLTKKLGASILISDAIIKRLPSTHGFLLRPLGSYCLMGKETPVGVADVMGEDDGSRFAQCIKEEITQVHEAVEYFQQCNLDKAQHIFAQLAVMARQEGQTLRAEGYDYLANKAMEYLAKPPELWDGAIHMEEK